MSDFRGEVEAYFRGLRDRIVARLGQLDGGEFQRKAWQRPGGGGGEMSELRGEVFEKGGCNFSVVSGEGYPMVPGAGAQGEGKTGEGAQIEADRLLGIIPPDPKALAGKPFFATGVSLVFHPKNPFVPVVHMNVRYFEAGDERWFGGGMDLTPYQPFDEDTAWFHGACERALAPHGEVYYPRFSKWAADYFYIPHRKSERGVGGIFFDYLRGDPRETLRLVQSVGDAFLEAYAPIVERRMHTPYSEADRAGQLKWRGRYVEFNLVYDRGTLFGLRTGGNVEAIFMSLPPLVSW
jgi:coproporphyrinogen III oxidase